MTDLAGLNVTLISASSWSRSARTDGHDKIARGRFARVFDPMLIVGTDKAYRPWSQPRRVVVDRDIHGALPNEPHFGMGMTMGWVRRAARRERGLVRLERLPGDKFSLKHSAGRRGARGTNRKLAERVHR